MLTINERKSVAQARGEEPREVTLLEFDTGGRSVYLRSDWPFPTVEGEGLSETGMLVQLERSYRRVVSLVRAVGERRAELEAGGKLTAAGVLEELAPVADARLRELEEIAGRAESSRAAAEEKLAEVALPGAASPFAVELRAALREIKDSGRRLETFNALPPEEQNAALAAPAIVSGLPADFHAKLKARAVAALPSGDTFREIGEKAEYVAGAVREAVEVVNVIAGRAPASGLPS